MKNCPGWISWVVLIIGILYLIKDLTTWNGWWDLNWWTAAFVLLGLGGILKKGK